MRSEHGPLAQTNHPEQERQNGTPVDGPQRTRRACARRRGAHAPNHLLSHSTNMPFGRSLGLFLLQRGCVLELVEHAVILVGARRRRRAPVPEAPVRRPVLVVVSRCPIPSRDLRQSPFPGPAPSRRAFRPPSLHRAAVSTRPSLHRAAVRSHCPRLSCPRCGGARLIGSNRRVAPTGLPPSVSPGERTRARIVRTDGSFIVGVKKREIALQVASVSAYVSATSEASAIATTTRMAHSTSACLATRDAESVPASISSSPKRRPKRSPTRKSARPRSNVPSARCLKKYLGCP